LRFSDHFWGTKAESFTAETMAQATIAWTAPAVAMRLLCCPHRSEVPDCSFRAIRFDG